MEFDNNRPIYMQIIDLIKKDLSQGRLKAGAKLPSTRDYSKELKVNPNTVARVYKELEMLGISFTKRGLGTFVVEDEDVIKKIKLEMAESVIEEFLRGLSELGISLDEAIEILKEKENNNE